ncbi:hypothetical protein [Pseudoroseomonas cervicalis]|uniref:hypothetical protein n=1 Tax=Teichococcus cervicalis TaxID=204525 RepID=UPI0034A03A87
MRSMTTAFALAAALMAAPAAMAQATGGTTGGSGAGTTGTTGTVGSPEAPRGGGTTMQQGTPGTGTTGAAPAPGMNPAPADGSRTERPSSGGANAPGTDSPPTTTTPAEGANSFTEGQARSRIEAAGYTDVRDLRKDDQGVWRGRAMRNGTQADVGLDFQGNVVTGNAPAR